MALNVEIKRRLQKSVQFFARWSFVVKGILFCSVSSFAVRTAIGLSSQEPIQKEVLKALFL